MEPKRRVYAVKGEKEQGRKEDGKSRSGVSHPPFRFVARTEKDMGSLRSRR